MKKNRVLQFKFLVVIMILASCKSQDVTFRKVYEKSMPESASGYARMKPDGSLIFAVEEEPRGFGSAKAFIVDGQTGDPLWERKAEEIVPGEGDAGRTRRFWQKNIMLVFKDEKKLFSSNNNTLYGMDIASGEVRFKIDAADYGGGWENWLFFLSSFNAFVLSTTNGLYAFDVESGQEIWGRPDIQGRIWGSSGRNKIRYQYFDQHGELFVSQGSDFQLLDPASGNTIWKNTDEDRGSLHNADLFVDSNIAVFYGSEDESLGNRIAESMVRSNELGNAVLNAAESGLVKEDIVLIDLETGEKLNQSEFYTNGQHFPMIHDDKLIMMGIVINVFDRSTGELIWQNIDESRFNTEIGMKALGFLSGIDLTVGNRSKQADLIFDNHIYAFYPEVLESASKQNQVSLRKYDLDTGEEIWKSETERITTDYYFGAEGVLFLVGKTSGFIPRPIVIAFDAANGEKLYEIKINATDYPEGVVTNGRLYMRLYPYDLRAFEVRTGKEIPLNLPGKGPGDMRLYGDDLLVAYGWPNFRNTLLVSHNPADFSVNNTMELPRYFRNYDYRGDTFFLYDLKSSAGTRGIIAIDLEQWILKGYILNNQSGTLSSTVGNKTKDEVYKDYHLFLTEDGSAIFELEKDVIKKYAVE